MTSPSPVVGQWYRRINGALFEIVAIDRDDGTIEVQHFDGTVEEFDLDSWEEQEFEEAQAPEDWTGSVDVEPEDYDNDREVSAIGSWRPASRRSPCWLPVGPEPCWPRRCSHWRGCCCSSWPSASSGCRGMS